MKKVLCLPLQNTGLGPCKGSDFLILNNGAQRQRQKSVPLLKHLKGKKIFLYYLGERVVSLSSYELALLPVEEL